MILMNKGRIIRHMETKEFFKDIGLLKKNSLKVPESVEILYYLYDKFGIDKTAPVKFDEVVAEIRQILKDRKEAC